MSFDNIIKMDLRGIRHEGFIWFERFLIKLLAYFLCFEKIKVGLCNLHAVSMYVCLSPPQYQLLNA
jgi:hypothetical protein